MAKNLEVIGIFKGESGRTIAKLIEIKEGISAEEIISDVEKDGLRPVTTEEFLSLTALCPELLS